MAYKNWTMVNRQEWINRKKGEIFQQSKMKLNRNKKRTQDSKCKCKWKWDCALWERKQNELITTGKLPGNEILRWKCELIELCLCSNKLKPFFSFCSRDLILSLPSRYSGLSIIFFFIFISPSSFLYFFFTFCLIPERLWKNFPMRSKMLWNNLFFVFSPPHCSKILPSYQSFSSFSYKKCFLFCPSFLFSSYTVLTLCSPYGRAFKLKPTSQLSTLVCSLSASFSFNFFSPHSLIVLSFSSRFWKSFKSTSLFSLARLLRLLLGI